MLYRNLSSFFKSSCLFFFISAAFGLPFYTLASDHFEVREESNKKKTILSREDKQLINLLNKLIGYLLLPNLTDQLKKKLGQRKDRKSKVILETLQFISKCYHTKSYPSLTEKLLLAKRVKNLFFADRSIQSLESITSVDFIEIIKELSPDINHFFFLKKSWLIDPIFQATIKVDKKKISRNKPITTNPLQEGEAPQILLNDLLGTYQLTTKKISLAAVLKELGIPFHDKDLVNLNNLLIAYQNGERTTELFYQLEKIIKRLKLPIEEVEGELSQFLAGDGKEQTPLLNCESYEKIRLSRESKYITFIPERDSEQINRSIFVRNANQKTQYQVIYFITEEGAVFFRKKNRFFCFSKNYIYPIEQERFFYFLFNSSLLYLVYGYPKKINLSKSINWLSFLSINPYYYLVLLQTALFLYLLGRKQSFFDNLFGRNRAKVSPIQKVTKSNKTSTNNKKRYDSGSDEGSLDWYERTIKDPAQKGMPTPIDPDTNQKLVIAPSHFTKKLEQIKLKEVLPKDTGNLFYYTNLCFFNVTLHFLSQLFFIDKEIQKNLYLSDQSLKLFPEIKEIEKLGKEQKNKAEKELKAVYRLFLDHLFKLTDKIHLKEEAISSKENGIVVNLFNQIVFLSSYYEQQVAQKKLGDRSKAPLQMPQIYYHQKQEDSSELFQKMMQLLFVPKLIEEKVETYNKNNLDSKKAASMHILRVPIEDLENATPITAILASGIKTTQFFDRIAVTEDRDNNELILPKRAAENISQLSRFISQDPPNKVKDSMLELAKTHNINVNDTTSMIALAIKFWQEQKNNPTATYFKDLQEKITEEKDKEYLNTLERIASIYELSDFSGGKVVSNEEEGKKILQKLLTTLLVRKICDKKKINEGDFSTFLNKIKNHRNASSINQLLGEVKKKSFDSTDGDNEYFNSTKEKVSDLLKKPKKVVIKDWICPATNFFEPKKTKIRLKKITTVTPVEATTYMVVQLLRFDREGKIKTPVTFSPTITIFERTWKMKALIEHNGDSRFSGHYTIYKLLEKKKNSNSGIWYHNNDYSDKMEKLFNEGSEEETNYFQNNPSKNAYMILYELIHDSH